MTASRIMEKIGKDALDVIENNPSWLCDIKGISPKRAREINESYVSQFGMRECLMFCRSFFGPALSVKIYRRYGSGAVEIIRQNPYRLCTEVPGVGFERADRLAMSVGFPAGRRRTDRSGRPACADPVRLRRGALLRPARNPCFRGPRGVLSCDTASVSAAVNRMISCGQLMLSEYCVPDAVALPEYYNAELAAAGKLLRLADTQPLVRLEGVEAEIETP